MFNMGMTTDFTSMVSKDSSGKNYHSALGQEIEKFLDKVLDKFGGVVGLVDLYCMYNRARGLDLISPDDLRIAAEEINRTSSKYMLKSYKSGVVTIQSRMFNEDSYYKRLADAIAETG
jgi:ESCRT-II complex subunit VPS36